MPCPTPAWAALVFPDLEPAERAGAARAELLHVLRLDEDDPIAAWKERADALVGAAERLSARRFDALHYEGPGTDLTVGLLPASSWLAARFETVDGIVHMPNLPTEEIFTSPDPSVRDGAVTSTKPLVLATAPSCAISWSASRAGGPWDPGVRGRRGAAHDHRAPTRAPGGWARCALVDREGRIGALGTIFYDTLLDENAASHIALGHGFPFVLEEAHRERSNESEIHIDFMIGVDELTVTGISASGDAGARAVEGHWQI